MEREGRGGGGFLEAERRWADAVGSWGVVVSEELRGERGGGLKREEMYEERER